MMNRITDMERTSTIESNRLTEMIVTKNLEIDRLKAQQNQTKEKANDFRHEAMQQTIKFENIKGKSEIETQ